MHGVAAKEAHLMVRLLCDTVSDTESALGRLGLIAAHNLVHINLDLENWAGFTSGKSELIISRAVYVCEHGMAIKLTRDTQGPAWLQSRSAIRRLLGRFGAGHERSNLHDHLLWVFSLKKVTFLDKWADGDTIYVHQQLVALV